MAEQRLITAADIERFNAETNVFSPAQKQDFINFLKLLKRKGISLQHAVDCIVAEADVLANVLIENQAFANDWRNIALKCEKCGRPMRLAPVNSEPGNMVGGRWKSQWYCPDAMGCGHYVLSRKNLSEIIAKQRRKANYRKGGKR